MSNPPAGWYPDPTGQPDTIRWWNGKQWTNRTEKETVGSTEPETVDEPVPAEPEVVAEPQQGVWGATASTQEGSGPTWGATQTGWDTTSPPQQGGWWPNPDEPESGPRLAAVGPVDGGATVEVRAGDGLTPFERARATWNAPEIAPAPPEHWTQQPIPEVVEPAPTSQSEEQMAPNGWTLRLADTPEADAPHADPQAGAAADAQADTAGVHADAQADAAASAQTDAGTAAGAHAGAGTADAAAGAHADAGVADSGDARWGASSSDWGVEGETDVQAGVSAAGGWGTEADVPAEAGGWGVEADTGAQTAASGWGAEADGGAQAGTTGAWATAAGGGDEVAAGAGDVAAAGGEQGWSDVSWTQAPNAARKPRETSAAEQTTEIPTAEPDAETTQVQPTWGAQTGDGGAQAQPTWGEQPGDEATQVQPSWGGQSGDEATQVQPTWGAQTSDGAAQAQPTWGAQSGDNTIQAQSSGQRGDDATQAQPTWGGQANDGAAPATWGAQTGGQAQSGSGGQTGDGGAQGQSGWGVDPDLEQGPAQQGWGVAASEGNTQLWGVDAAAEGKSSEAAGAAPDNQVSSWGGQQTASGEQAGDVSWGAQSSGGGQQGGAGGWGAGQGDGGPWGGQQASGWGAGTEQGASEQKQAGWGAGQGGAATTQAEGGPWGGGQQAGGWGAGPGSGGPGRGGGKATKKKSGGSSKKKSSGGGGGRSGAKLPLIVGGGIALVMLVVAAVFLIVNPGDKKKADPGPTTPTSQPTNQPTGATKPGESKNPKLHEGERIAATAISFPRRTGLWSDRKRLVPQLLDSSGQYIVLQQKFDGTNNWYANIFVGALGNQAGYGGDPKASALALANEVPASLYGGIAITRKPGLNGQVKRSDKSGWFVQQTITAKSGKVTARVLTLTVAVFDLGDGTAVAYISDIPTNRPDLKAAESQAYKGINVG
ncbi:hypothetical protein GCM10009745_28730 [Kribbella yunnanensis]|uniref:DUF2510 domain-containing protein n=1 Tax=Kribbella yunnanensis TaxID=190194 RepID=A0ABP4T613_9ACTN